MKRGNRCVFCNEVVIKDGDIVYRCYNGCGALFDVEDFEDDKDEE